VWSIAVADNISLYALFSLVIKNVSSHFWGCVTKSILVDREKYAEIMANIPQIMPAVIAQMPEFKGAFQSDGRGG
jgi:hypothetical protein